MTITLSQAKTTTITPAVAAVTVSVTEVELVSISDNCATEVKAVIKVAGKGRVLVLWKDADYTAIGDWTQAQANARIEELL
jgi:hypothetical protein